MTGSAGLCLGVRGKGELCVQINGKDYKKSLDGAPDTLIIPTTYYPAGPLQLKLTGANNLEVYGAILAPTYLKIPSFQWATLGAFPTQIARPRRIPAGEIKKDMAHNNTPALKFDIHGTYPGANGKISWKYPGEDVFANNAKIDFGVHNNSLRMDMCYAATVITTPQPDTVQLLISTDWWANAWLNGQPVKSDRDSKAVNKDGCSFNTWSYTPATLKLKKGKNLLVVKNHGGSQANWFKAVITDTGSMKIAPPK